MARGKPLFPIVYVPSNVGGKPLVQPTLSVSGVVTSTRQTSTVGKSMVYDPPTHTHMLNPISTLGQPLGVQSVVNQPYWGYGYPKNQLPIVNMN